MEGSEMEDKKLNKVCKQARKDTWKHLQDLYGKDNKLLMEAWVIVDEGICCALKKSTTDLKKEILEIIDKYIKGKKEVLDAVLDYTNGDSSPREYECKSVINVLEEIKKAIGGLE